MRVGLYLENKNIQNIDLSQPWLGNPGCGGAEFLFVALSYELQKRQSTQCKLILLANSIDRLPKILEARQVSDVCDAARMAKDERCNFFIYRPRRREQMNILDLIEKLNLPTIGWAHITPNTSYLRKMASISFFKALVCVEHEQYDLIQDSPLWKKLTYIRNGFDVDNFRLSILPEKDFSSVVYLGSLVPQKGFHLLAKVWKSILQRVPHAKLTVVGTGALYKESAKLGPWGVAEKGYEEKYIIPYLVDSVGQPHSSVHFAGKLGHEKKELLHQALIGVPNPTGATECCPGSVLEFGACGTAVVTGAFYGMMDTISDGVTGLLGRTERDLINNICTLLNNPEKARQMGKNGEQFVQQKYNYDKITNQWMNLFDNLSHGKRLRYIPFKKNIFRHWKWAVFINRFFQKMVGGIFLWPSVSELKIFLISIFQKLRWG